MEITDFMNVEGFIKILEEKLDDLPSLDLSVNDAEGNKVGIVKYFSITQINNAIRSILSPTKAIYGNNETRQRKCRKDKKLM